MVTAAGGLGPRRRAVADGRLFRGAPVTEAFFGENLTDTHSKVSGAAFSAPLSYARYFPGPPLTFGGSLRYSF